MGKASDVDETARPRVMVAEDEALIRLDLVELLQDEGYEVVGQAGDGESAVEMARELKPDLVVMDVRMPRMDGIAAADVIASERIAPVVMLTAYSQRELVEQAREAGAMAYVVKPFDASDVVPAIEIAMARFAEIRAVEDEVLDLEERLESRRIVDQAKGILQEALGLTEPEAFRWIQKTAMDLRKSMRDVAEGVISHGKGGATAGGEDAAGGAPASAESAVAKRPASTVEGRSRTSTALAKNSTTKSSLAKIPTAKSSLAKKPTAKGNLAKEPASKDTVARKPPEPGAVDPAQ